MKRFLLAASAVALTAGGFIPFGLSPAGADPASSGAAAAFGASVDLAGQPVLEPSAVAAVVLPPGGDTGQEELIEVPVNPVAVDGAATAEANAHVASDIPSALEQAQQAVAGPYNLRAVGEVDELDVLITPIGGVEQGLVSATAVRGEAVGVCRGGQALYAASSEVVDLNVGGADIPLNQPLTDILNAIDGALGALAPVADIKLNEIVQLPNGGIAVNALHVTVLGALDVAGAEPLLDLVVGHAEVGGLQCAPVAQCSDTQDNDGDGVIDANDPGCINNGVYDPNDNDERNTLPATAAVGDALPRTGGDLSATAPIAIGLSVLAFAALALRRRSQT